MQTRFKKRSFQVLSVLSLTLSLLTLISGHSHAGTIENSLARRNHDLLGYDCLYLNGHSQPVSFEMKTQFSDAVVDRFQKELDLEDGNHVSIQAQALNEDKRDTQLTLTLSKQGNRANIFGFAGAVADSGNERLGTIGMTGANGNKDTVQFQIDCKRKP